MASNGSGATVDGGNEFKIPETMKAWVLGGPEQLSMVEKPVPEPAAPKCWCGSTRSRCAPPISKSSARACRR